MLLVKGQLTTTIQKMSLGNVPPSLRNIFIRSCPVQKDVECSIALRPELKIFYFIDNGLHKLLRVLVAVAVGHILHQGYQLLDFCLLIYGMVDDDGKRWTPEGGILVAKGTCSQN